MRLPKYEPFSVVGFLNISTGIFIYNNMINKEIPWYAALLVMLVVEILYIVIYDIIRTKLDKKELKNER